MEPSLQELKRRFLKLPDEYMELRYTVAGYLGLSEIVKKARQDRSRTAQDARGIQQALRGP